MKCDATRAETRFRLSAKRTSPFKSAGASVQSTTGSRGVSISDSNAGYTMFRGSVKGTGNHSIRMFPLHFPSSASPCAITFQLDSTIRYKLGDSNFVLPVRKELLSFTLLQICAGTHQTSCAMRTGALSHCKKTSAWHRTPVRM